MSNGALWSRFPSQGPVLRIRQNQSRITSDLPDQDLLDLLDQAWGQGLDPPADSFQKPREVLNSDLSWDRLGIDPK